MERIIKWTALAYGVAGTVGFLAYGGWTAMVNFLVGFVMVMLNFMYLESFSRKIVEKDPTKAQLAVLITLFRYPLIALVLYGIVSWRYFQKIPLIVGVSAIVFAILTYSITQGAKKTDAS